METRKPGKMNKAPNNQKEEYNALLDDGARAGTSSEGGHGLSPLRGKEGKR